MENWLVERGQEAKNANRMRQQHTETTRPPQSAEGLSVRSDRVHPRPHHPDAEREGARNEAVREGERESESRRRRLRSTHRSSARGENEKERREREGKRGWKDHPTMVHESCARETDREEGRTKHRALAWKGVDKSERDALQDRKQPSRTPRLHAARGSFSVSMSLRRRYWLMTCRECFPLARHWSAFSLSPRETFKPHERTIRDFLFISTYVRNDFSRQNIHMCRLNNIISLRTCRKQSNNGGNFPSLLIQVKDMKNWIFIHIRLRINIGNKISIVFLHTCIYIYLYAHCKYLYLIILIIDGALARTPRRNLAFRKSARCCVGSVWSSG